MQMHVGVLDRVAGNTERFGQHPGRRQLQASIEGPLQNQCTQGALDPLMQIQPLKLGIVEPDFQCFELEGVRHAVCSV